jgi:hypothetical protein
VKFIFEGKEYRVWFAYPASPYEEKELRSTLAYVATREEIEASKASGAPWPRWGWATCSEMDRFERSKGRKIALARALAGQTKAFRRAAWKGYLARGQA